MSADIIPFRGVRASGAVEASADSVMQLFTAHDAPRDLQARYEEALPIAREFVQAWRDQPEALADFLAWAHARGAMKF